MDGSPARDSWHFDRQLKTENSKLPPPCWLRRLPFGLTQPELFGTVKFLVARFSV